MEWVQALPPTLWHCVPALHFDNCTLIQMDIIGFSDIVMRLEVTSSSSRRSITGMSTHIY